MDGNQIQIGLIWIVLAGLFGRNGETLIACLMVLSGLLQIVSGVFQ